MENPDQPTQPDSQKEDEEPVSSVDQLFKKLVELEETKANTEELLSEVIPCRLSQDDQEYNILVDAGIDPLAIEERRLTRKQLLDAGFAFNNILGQGEKPIIKGVINDKDFSRRKLLTREELDEIIKHQSSDEGTSHHDKPLDDIRRDMLSFMLTAGDIRPQYMAHRVNLIRMVKHDIVKKGYQFARRITNSKLLNLYSELVDTHFESIYQASNNDNPFYSEYDYITQNYQDIYPWLAEEDPDFFKPQIARGHQITIIDSRKRALRGEPSPFLDSAFHFPFNHDVTINLEKLGTVRLNTAVLHLASRGLSEMGDGGDRSHDQHYLTISEYEDHIFPNEEEIDEISRFEDEKFQAQQRFDETRIIEQMQDRMIQLAKTWANSDEAPQEIKKIKDKISKLEEKQRHVPIHKRIFRRATRRQKH